MELLFPALPIVIALAFLVILGLIVLVIFSVVALVIELIVVGVGIFALNKPWIVVAETEGPPPAHREWRIRGRRRSEEAVREVARELEGGIPAAP